MQRPNDCVYGGMVECDPGTCDCDLCGWNPVVKERRLRKLEEARVKRLYGKE